MLNRALINVSLPIAFCLCAGLMLWGITQGVCADATISSDEMELLEHGKMTVFTGHVVLKKDLYTLKANRMTRTQESGIAEGHGHVVGSWVRPPKGKAVVKGEHARYDPATEIAELWEAPGKKVSVEWQDEKGSGHFTSERAILYQNPRHVQLVNQVVGRVTPAPRPAQ